MKGQLKSKLAKRAVNGLNLIIVSGCAEGDIRLRGGSNYTEGRLEICLSNEWGTVCNRMWDDTDARVVCRQLGLSLSGKFKMLT